MTTGYQFALREKTNQLKAEVYGENAPDVITLPWPPKELNPNRREHWTTEWRKTQAYKKAVHTLLLEHRRMLKGKSAFRITFKVPSHRRYDRDNIIRAFKAGQDALSIVTGIDDSQFDIAYGPLGYVKGGAVEIQVLG